MDEASSQHRRFNLHLRFCLYSLESERVVTAVPTGFEPAISALTGQRVKPSYTTGPFYARKGILLYIPSDVKANLVKANLYVGAKIGYTTLP